MNLTKVQYLALVKSLEIRNLTLGLETNPGNDFQQKEINEKQDVHITEFEKLQHEIYNHAKDYGLEKEFETHPDTGLLVLKTDSKLSNAIFDAIEKQEKAITYEMIVREVVAQKAKRLKEESTSGELQFSVFSPIIQAISEKVYVQLMERGLESVLLKNLDVVEHMEIMKQVFNHFSGVAIKLGDVKFSPEQIKNGYIGTQPASENKIKQAEQRLNLELPEDYKELLMITNGFSAPNTIEPSFLPVENIDFLKHIDADLIEAYSTEGIEHVGKQLERSVLIGGLGEEQHFLLIPPKDNEDQWHYWKFANWIPGEEPYNGLEDYVRQVIEFNLNELKEI